MLKRFFGILIALVASVCVISSSFGAVAITATPDLDIDGDLEEEENGLGGDTETNEGTDSGDNDEDNGSSGNTGGTGNTGTTDNTEPNSNNGNTGNDNNKRPVVNEPVEDEEEEEEETTEEETTEVVSGPFKVYLNLNGGESVYEKNEFRLEASGLLPKPEDPTKVGYLFDGWYRDAALTVAWDFDIDVALSEMTLYAKWVRDPDAILYDIVILDVDGGKITVRPEKAAAGETVLIMIQPEEGMRLKKGSLVINGVHSDILSFEMPAGDVIIDAEFELTPIDKEDDGNAAVIVVVVLAVVVIGALGAFVIIKRRNNAIIVPEFDENGALIIDDDEEVWIDESIVVESGFQDGKKATDINPPKIEDFDSTISVDDID